MSVKVNLSVVDVDSAIFYSKVFGVSGVATAGKDTFFVYFQEYLAEFGIKAKRFALADELKHDMAGFIQDKFSIDVFTQNKEQKNLIRPLFVAYGRVRRVQSKGTYWTSFLTPKIEQSIRDGYVPVVTDIRYAEYDKDEIYWMKDRMGGKVIHIQRLDEEGVPIVPPNEDERINDPIVRRLADYQISVRTIEDLEERKRHYFEIIERILTSEQIIDNG